MIFAANNTPDCLIGPPDADPLGCRLHPFILSAIPTIGGDDFDKRRTVSTSSPKTPD